jgi:O-antigen/teichoic acid export membrane protein
MSSSRTLFQGIPAATRSLRRLMPESARAIITNSMSMAGTTLVTAVLGAAFWWLAAREFPRQDVGVASAAVSAMTLLGTFATLGMNTLLMGELADRPGRPGPFITASLAVTAAAGTVFGFLFAVVVPLVSPDLTPLSADVGAALLFAAGVALTTIGLVFDQALIGLLQGNLQLWRNTLFSSSKLLALIVPAVLLSIHTSMAIYGVWAFGNLFSLVWIAAREIRMQRGWRGFAPDFNSLRGIRGSALGHHVFNLALKTPMLALPILVVTLLSAKANASFYIAYMIAGFVFMIPIAFATVLYAVGTGDAQTRAGKFRLSFGITVSTSLAANVIIFAAAGFMLGIFGSKYAHEASWSLRVLALASFPLIVKNHFVAICRVTGRVRSAAPYVWLATLLELTLASVGAEVDGITGLSVGWAIALTIEALLMSPTVYRTLFPSTQRLSHDGRPVTT